MKQDIDKNVYLKILKLLSVKGTHFTTEDLARALGTSKRTIYMNFKNKYDIIDKTIDFVFRDIMYSDQMILEAQDTSLNENIRKYFQNIPDTYHIGVLIRHADDFQRFYPQLWNKVDHYINSIWDGLIQLVESGIQSGSIYPVNTTVLRLMLDQTLEKLLDYEFTLQNQISFESGMHAMCDIVLFGMMDRAHTQEE